MKQLLDAIRLVLTLRCEQSTKIVSESMDRKLTFAERWAVRLHYISCWSCRRFGRQLRQLRGLMQAQPPQHPSELSAQSMQRIQDAIRQTD